MSKRPQDYVNLAALAINIAQRWANNYPNYTVKFANFVDFTIEAQNFQLKVIENATHDIRKKANTLVLQAVNKEIVDSIKVLRKYIKAEYPTEKDLSAILASFGLEKNLTGMYNLPNDNDRRQQCLNLLVTKMSEPNNFVANKPVGLQVWQLLRERHANAWNESKNIKSQKTSLSRETRAYALSVDEVLRKLYAQIKIDFPKHEVAKILREFGFLSEIYK